ncbi:endopeptidase La [Arcticibacterium luteifluviistationis]|uniref:Lon protease n=1 Tax=Arcticibacterium luteifluviistationis TaxID=1784714 RepID=A0A2Z4GA42_9BACT|nr:endopeptidase La [Arcticibacterium luteifluviistationis]AWV98112.1 endopeptidase La [Arcticibacterium luteifluviistationis]
MNKDFELLEKFANPSANLENVEMIEIASPDEVMESDENLPENLPLLPLRNTVLFPGIVIPVTVTRTKAIRLVKKAYRGDRTLGIISQVKQTKEEPKEDDLYKIGTVGNILKMIVLPDGNVTIIVQGRRRFKITSILKTNPYLTAAVEYITDSFPNGKKKETKALISTLKDTAANILNLNPEIPRDAQLAINNIESPIFLTHFLSSNLNIDISEKQLLLETYDGGEQAHKLLEHMLKEVEVLEIKKDIQSKASSDIDQQQREYYLRQQIKVLQEELGSDSPDQEIEKLRMKGAKKKWSPEVNEHFNKELNKIQRLNSMAPEYAVAVGYAELLSDLPWNDSSGDSFNLKRAKKILDEDHYGLKKVKERIIEYLAVLKLRKDMKAPILCFYGPPGVGKTSLGKSIAKALGREYVRMALGGVHDESEIRGHRKTYIGAMPGKIIQNINKAKKSNPVFVLDEIDKISRDQRGDPSSALLEVLDPEQNSAFKDNYLEVDYDLSKVLFIATANSLDTIQSALRDRMEIIELTGYTVAEKVEIAKRHLLPKQLMEHGMTAKDLKLSKDALTKLVEGYTRESGVRALEQKVGTVVRKIAKAIAMEEEYNSSLKAGDIEELLGQPIFDKDLYEGNEMAGVVTGLAWTPVGGDILFIESNLSRGKGVLTLSGQLGDVMKESAMTALSYLKSNSDSLNIDYRIFQHYDLHIHVPQGAVPKDGPSAGITMLTSMASIFTQRKIKNNLAMTGEITLRGKVLPVGGIKEKILAAKRANIKEIILCYKNQKDVEEIGEEYTKGLKFHYVDLVPEVLEVALLKTKVDNAIEFILPKPKDE